MNLVKRNPRNFFMDEFFKDWAGGTQMAHRAVPAVNIKETDAAYAVELAAPGLKKEDFAIEVDNGVLAISYTAAEKTKQEDGKYTRREFVSTSFKRAFTLPETVNEEEIKAVYENGILTLTLPKKEEAQPKAKRLVAIS